MSFSSSRCRTASPAAMLALLVALLAGGLVTAPASRADSGTPPRPVVVGNRLVDARTGADLRVAGVNRSGSEYACVQGWGLFDGPVDDRAIAAITTWGTNAIRIPLNESCWLGINGVRPEYAGEAYRDAVEQLVDRAARHGLTAVLDLHWASPGGVPATHQQVAPNADHTPAFWSSVATRFGSSPSVMFELYNEPRDISWACWRDGCTTPAGWTAVGAQRLVDVVRATGARQPIILDGLNWGGDLSQWSQYAPHDPLDSLVAGWHVYNFSGCRTPSCWDQTVAPVLTDHPVLLTEVGQDGCATDFLETILPWADAHRVGYIAWSWNTASCGSGPALISDYQGTPTTFGAGYRTHLRQRPEDPAAPAPTPAPPAPAQAADPTARFDFEDGTTQGWTTRWGTLDVSGGDGPASSGSQSLSLRLGAAGYPAIGVERGLAGLRPGALVGYRVLLPAAAGTRSGVGVAPVLYDGRWTAAVLRHQALHPGWNTVLFRVPRHTTTVKVLGLQIDNPLGWKGALSFDRVTVARPRHTFEARSDHGWRVLSGRTTFRRVVGSARDGRAALGVTLGAGAHHRIATTQVTDLVGGGLVSVSVWAPRRVRASVAPVAHTRPGARTAPARQLRPGWNDLTLTVPTGDLTALGLQVTTQGGWRGRVLLDSVSW